MQVSSSTQVSQVSSTNSAKSNAIAENKEYEAGMWNDPIFDLSKEFPEHIVKTIEKIAEEKNMTGMEKILFADSILFAASDYYAGKDIHPFSMVGNDANGNPIHTDTVITKQQLKNINFDAFLSKALSSFTKGMNETKGAVQDNYQRLINNFSMLQESYNQVKKEPIYA